MIAQGSNTSVVIKEQSAFDTPATGTGGTIVNILAGSAGLTTTVQTIDSAILDRSNMKGLSEPGSISGAGAYNTESRVGNLDVVFKAVLGSVVAAQDLDESDLVSVTITGTGTIATFGADAVALGLRAGMVLRFTNLSVAGNNNVDVMIIDFTSPTVAVLAAGKLADNATDSAFNVHVYKAFLTPDPRPNKYYTVEEKLTDIADSLLGTDGKFTGLTLGVQANQPMQSSFTMAFRDVAPVDTYPNFNSETDGTVAGSNILKLYEGAVYQDGVALVGITGVQMGLSANSTITPLATSRIGLDVGVSPFGFTGQITQVLLDLDTIRKFRSFDPISIAVMFTEGGLATDGFISVYGGNARYANASGNIPEQDRILTAPIYCGLDTRGDDAGYARSTLVISTSAP